RPQLVGSLRVYTEAIQESQGGVDAEADPTPFTTRGGRVNLGYRTGLSRDHGSYRGQAMWGKGRSVSSGRTEGLYRSLTGTADMYVVRTAVHNVVDFSDGTDPVRTQGEIYLLVAKADVLRGDRSGFDDPYGLLEQEKPPAPRAVRQASQSLREGRLWPGVWTEPIGDTPLSVELKAKAKELGGDDLEFQVGQVLGALSVRLPQLDDGGHSWEFETNGTRYELVLEAHAVGRSEEHTSELQSLRHL